MKYFRIFPACFLAAILLCVPVARYSAGSVAAEQAQNDKKETTVWVNTKSGVYHCPGDRWYGTTKEGKYMSECEAEKAGDRPAYGKRCGPPCQNAPVKQ